MMVALTGQHPEVCRAYKQPHCLLVSAQVDLDRPDFSLPSAISLGSFVPKSCPLAVISLLTFPEPPPLPTHTHTSPFSEHKLVCHLADLTSCRYGETLLPDVWFEAKVVWEVKAADLSISPVHQAAVGMADAVKGISIRFPRLVRVRDDKGPEQTTGAEQVVEWYQKQPHVQGNKPGKPAADDEY